MVYNLVQITAEIGNAIQLGSIPIVIVQTVGLQHIVNLIKNGLMVCVHFRPVPVLVLVLVLVLDPVLASMNWIYTFSTTTAITKRWTTQLLVLQNIGELTAINSICLPLDYALRSL